MKELIIALQACLRNAALRRLVTGDQYSLIKEHIESLVDTTIRTDAIEALTQLRDSPDYRLDPDTAAGALAKVTMMLTPYGSKPDAILAVIHDKGWEVVTLDDVNAVRTFILEQ
jgi:hypothetical protein